jgi:hypothetical protein
MTGMQGRRVRELSEEDRMVLLRLTQQVTEIGERLNTLAPGVQAAVPVMPSAPAPAAREATPSVSIWR